MADIKYALVLLVLLFVLCIAGFFKYRSEYFVDTPFSLKPTLWWILDSDTNSRHWWDFGARNSQEVNRGYVQVALDCARATQGGDFKIVVLQGRQEVAKHLSYVPEGYNQLPAAIWREFVKADILANKGGLVVLGDSVLFMGPPMASEIVDVQAAVFGTSANESKAVPGSSRSPSPWMGYAAKPGSPSWVAAADIWKSLVNAGPTAWTAAEARRLNMKVADVQKENGIAHISYIEGSRKQNGSDRTLEDLFDSQAEPADPNLAFLPGTVYVPMDGDALVRSAKFGWFVRMSPKQILESNFVWADLAKKCISKAA
jgi:hypothetical protein